MYYYLLIIRVEKDGEQKTQYILTNDAFNAFNIQCIAEKQEPTCTVETQKLKLMDGIIIDPSEVDSCSLD